MWYPETTQCPPVADTHMEATVDDPELTAALTTVLSRLGITDNGNTLPPPPPAPAGLSERLTGSVEQATTFIDKIKDNIAYILGLPATIGGAFGFLWDSSADEAALVHQVAMLEEAVADLKAEGDLLGGGTKNFSIDMSAAPGGSVTVIIVAAVIAVGVGLLFWYQHRRRR